MNIEELHERLGEIIRAHPGMKKWVVRAWHNNYEITVVRVNQSDITLIPFSEESGSKKR